MCMGGGGPSAEDYYNEMEKPEKKPLPSLSIAKRGSREPRYGNAKKKGQERRSLIMPYGLSDE